jgi:hypothetical protein
LVVQSLEVNGTTLSRFKFCFAWGHNPTGFKRKHF